MPFLVVQVDQVQFGLAGQEYAMENPYSGTQHLCVPLGI